MLRVFAGCREFGRAPPSYKTESSNSRHLKQKSEATQCSGLSATQQRSAGERRRGESARVGWEVSSRAESEEADVSFEPRC